LRRKNKDEKKIYFESIKPDYFIYSLMKVLFQVFMPEKVSGTAKYDVTYWPPKG
tara:strand:+ start:1797 stop:1958 length:162 start_codon:yes stop_codon:yes gene_type:complete